MNRRALAIAAALHLAAFVAAVALLAVSVLRDLAAELADDVRASRHENRNRLQGWNMGKNRKLTDIVSQHRASNARLAALVGDTDRAEAVLADARYYAGNAALPIRRAS